MVSKVTPAVGTSIAAPDSTPPAARRNAFEPGALLEALTPAPRPEAVETFDHTPDFAPSTAPAPR